MTKLKAVVSTIEKSGPTVCVACKIPNGLKLQLQTTMPTIVDTPRGPEMKDFWVKGGREWNVRGPAYPVAPPAGYPKPPMIEGGYAITRGIPKEFWDKWYEQNRNASYCQPHEGSEHGFIFAYADLDDTIAAAIEHEELLTGLEPLSTEVDAKGRLKDKRVPRPLSAGMSGVMPDDSNQGA